MAQCNKGMGMCESDIAYFFRLVKNKGFDPNALWDWNGKYAIDKYALEILGIEKRKYITVEVRVDGWPTVFILKFIDPLEALRRLWADPRNAKGFVHRAAPTYEGEDRVYGAAETGTLWEEAQWGDEGVCVSQWGDEEVCVMQWGDEEVAAMVGTCFC
ncbi:unnamed protein product [Closterium sp. NIES-65]|nr:unnamed protein product [Closterium sp. NIES-65]